MTVNVTEDSLDWALAHAERYGDTDLFPIPFELKAIRHSWDRLRTNLSNKDLDNRPVEEMRRCIAPKGLYSYRVVTQLDPVDFLFYTALVYEIGSDLEEFRIAASENVVHSFRFNPESNGRIFDINYNYGSFLETCQEYVDSDRYGYVVVADIADFFPRVYLHRIESALDLGTDQDDKARAIIKLFKGWHDRISYGIPVGSAVSRLIAETTINDVDQYLLSLDTKYCRYSDDFRIFCESKSEAYNKLESLASILFENHGLFLQPGKTEIISIELFEKKYLQTHFATELSSLRERFSEILENLGLEDPYGEIDYDELEDEVREEVDSLNLQELLDEQLEKEVIDVGMFRFLLRRLGQLNQPSGISKIFENIEKCYHLVPAIITYLQSLDGMSEEQIGDYSRQLVDLMSNSMIIQIPFNRCWILSLFSDNKIKVRPNVLTQLFSRYPDNFSQRKVILSLGCAKQHYWFRNMKSEVMHLSPWSRRALIAASSCMASEEVRVWHSSLRSRLDDLEKAIVDWVRENPF